MRNLALLAGLLVMALTMTALPMTATAATPAAKPDPMAIPVASDMAMGSPTAKVTIIEYGSVACPFCAHFNETVLPELKAKYIDTGKVRYIYRPMLTGVMSIAMAGELMAECAGKDKYFSVVDAVMRGQHQFYAMGENDMLARPVLLHIASTVGMDQAAFTACTTNPAAYKALMARYNGYLDAGVTSTPTLYLNGQPFEYKGNGISEFDAAIAKVK